MVKLSAKDVLEISSLYGSYMYQEAAERGYDAKARDEAFKDFTTAADKLGIDVNQAKSIAYIGVDNYAALKKMVEIEEEISACLSPPAMSDVMIEQLEAQKGENL